MAQGGVSSLRNQPVIRRLEARDFWEWLRMRTALWPETDVSTLESEMKSIAADPENQPVFVAQSERDNLIGFVEISIHPHALGCETHPVGYIEGWYVDPVFRRSGVGRRLVEAGERWMRERGCQESASDAHAHNTVSCDAHRSLGYVVTGELVHFKKKL